MLVFVLFVKHHYLTIGKKHHQINSFLACLLNYTVFIQKVKSNDTQLEL